MNSLSIALNVRELHYFINKSALLKINTLKIKAGECLLLRGANGSGKTTLFKILAGLLKPAYCEVLLNGNWLSWSLAAKQLRQQAVYVHQQPYMFDRSVANNIAFGLRNNGWRSIELRERVQEALEWADIVALKNRNALELSGGERQRVALARAWVLRPKLLLLDEPSSGLDVKSRQRVYQYIAGLTELGVTVLVSSHEMLKHPFEHRQLLLRDAGLQLIN